MTRAITNAPLLPAPGRTAAHALSSNWKLMAVAMLIGLNLRPALAAIGPLADTLQAGLHLNYTALSWLTLLPVLAMGLGCFITLKLRQHISAHRLIQLSLWLLLLANGLRGADVGQWNFALLVLTSLQAGAGIAVIQAAMPVVIKQLAGPHSARIMGFYVAAIMAGAAIAASLTPYLFQWSDNWHLALASWAVVAIIALFIWSDWRDALPTSGSVPAQAYWLATPRLLSLTTTFTLAAAGYVCVLAWLPPFLLDQGLDATQSGLWLGYLTAIEVVAGFVFPYLASRSDDRRWALFTVLALSISGFLWLALTPSHTSVWIPMTLLGLGIGGQFPLVMITTMDHHPDAQKAGALTALVQGYGYSLAAFMPLLMGALRDYLGSFNNAWLVLALMYALVIVLIIRYNPKHYPALRRTGKGT